MESRRRYRVAFICVKNSCRSQMAEALARHLAGDIIDPVSGGTEPAEHVDQGAVEAMRGVGIEISRARPKQLSREVLESLDFVVHMGCGAPGMCPIIPGAPSEDWAIEDPAGKPPEKYMETLRQIEVKVLSLAALLRSGRLPHASSEIKLELSP